MKRGILGVMLALSASGAMAAALPTEQRHACVMSAAAMYGVRPDLIYAVIKTEGGTTGQTVGNKNGSRDMGLMQINTIHLSELARYGITRELIINDECLNIHIGTFILHRELSKPGDLWVNIGAYNSRTPKHNVVYQQKVWKNLQRVWNGR